MPWIRLFFALCCAKEANNKYPLARLQKWLGMMKKAYPEAAVLFDAIRTLKEPAAVAAILAA